MYPSLDLSGQVCSRIITTGFTFTTLVKITDDGHFQFIREILTPDNMIGWTEVVCGVNGEEGVCMTTKCQPDEGQGVYIDDDGKCMYFYWITITVYHPTMFQCLENTWCFLEREGSKEMKHELKKMSEVIECELLRYSKPVTNMLVTNILYHYPDIFHGDVKHVPENSQLYTLHLEGHSEASFKTKASVEFIADIVSDYFQKLELDTENSNGKSSENRCQDDKITRVESCPQVCVRIDRGQRSYFPCGDLKLMNFTHRTKMSDMCSNGRSGIPKMTLPLILVCIVYACQVMLI